MINSSSNSDPFKYRQVDCLNCGSEQTLFEEYGAVLSYNPMDHPLTCGNCGFPVRVENV